MRRLLLLVALVGVGWTVHAVAAEAPAAQEAEQPDLAKALAGFKGFIVGELAKTTDAGCVLFVRAVALVEGNAAPNPGVLIAREAPIAYVLKKDAKGEKRPDAVLAKTVAKLQITPAFQLGGAAGTTVVMDVAQGGIAVAGGGNVGAATTGVTMRIRGMDIITDDDGDEPDREPKGPLVTARARAGDDGKLVMDRVMTGSAMAATWGAMPKLQVAPGAEAIQR